MTTSQNTMPFPRIWALSMSIRTPPLIIASPDPTIHITPSVSNLTDGLLLTIFYPRHGFKPPHRAMKNPRAPAKLKSKTKRSTLSYIRLVDNSQPLALYRKKEEEMEKNTHHDTRTLFALRCDTHIFQFDISDFRENGRPFIGTSSESTALYHNQPFDTTDLSHEFHSL